MPDLTVIDGGNNRRSPDAEWAQYHLEEFIISLLRNLASGQLSYTIDKHLADFAKHASNCDEPLHHFIKTAVGNLNSRAFSDVDELGFKNEIQAVERAALMVVAEAMAKDGAARARHSKREQTFRSLIERVTLERERRSRERGWSYLEDLLRGFDDTSRKKGPPRGK
jgi:hypothetical protein